MKRIGIVVATLLSSAQMLPAAEWTLDLGLGGGEFSSSMAATREDTFEHLGHLPFRFVNQESVMINPSLSSSFSLGARRFWLPRFATTLRASHAELDTETGRRSASRFESLTTHGEAFESSVRYPSRKQTANLDVVSLGVEYHLRDRGKLDPYVGVFAGAVRYKGESVSFAFSDAPVAPELLVNTAVEDFTYGLLVGLDIDVGDAGAFFSLAARWGTLTAGPKFYLSEFDGPRSVDARTTTRVEDDSLIVTTIEAGIGLRLGSN